MLEPRAAKRREALALAFFGMRSCRDTFEYRKELRFESPNSSSIISLRYQASWGMVVVYSVKEPTKARLWGILLMRSLFLINAHHMPHLERGP